MNSLFTEKGIVLKSEPIGEYDRRLVILTKDSGKISAFAKGARRQGNHLMAASDVFCFGDFKLYAGSNSYSLTDANILNYFPEFRSDLDCSLYGMYFLEAMNYFTRENNDEEKMLILLYQSLRAVISPNFDNRLVKAIFELKVMCLMGEFSPEECFLSDKVYSDSLKYTVNFIYSTSPIGIYKFALKDEVLLELIGLCEIYKDKLWKHEFTSETLLKI